MESRKRSAEESNESSEASKKSKETRILHNTLAAYGSRQGERADMQDTHILVPKFYLGDDTSFFKPIWKDGTTATTMVILNNVIYVANIGDSKAVVARKKEDGSFAPVCLTADHNPMAHDERMRIQKTGAVVKDGRINGVIEVSRSIGDLPFKSSGIVSTPDLKKLTLTENDL
uniref:PPM-type phosphatase domain-containing protein n=1 Tax=Caenorhabditis tropicalis TaxID=1561998 RepID=A0A1I7U9W9_9PELO